MEASNSKIRHKVGEIVEYTNDYGVKWGRREIVDTYTGADGYTQYYIAPTTSPWAPVYSRNLVLSKNQNRIAPPELAKELENNPQKYPSMRELVPLYSEFGMYNERSDY